MDRFVHTRTVKGVKENLIQLPLLPDLSNYLNSNIKSKALDAWCLNHKVLLPSVANVKGYTNLTPVNGGLFASVPTKGDAAFFVFRDGPMTERIEKKFLLSGGVMIQHENAMLLVTILIKMFKELYDTIMFECSDLQTAEGRKAYMTLKQKYGIYTLFRTIKTARFVIAYLCVNRIPLDNDARITAIFACKHSLYVDHIVSCNKSVYGVGCAPCGTGCSEIHMMFEKSCAGSFCLESQIANNGKNYTGVKAMVLPDGCLLSLVDGGALQIGGNSAGVSFLLSSALERMNFGGAGESSQDESERISTDNPLALLPQGDTTSKIVVVNGKHTYKGKDVSSLMSTIISSEVTIHDVNSFISTYAHASDDDEADANAPWWHADIVEGLLLGS